MRSIRGPSFWHLSVGSLSLLGSLNEAGLGVEQVALSVEKAASVVANDRHRHRPTRGGKHANDEPLAPVSLEKRFRKNWKLCDHLDSSQEIITQIIFECKFFFQIVIIRT